jgi:hypothetical protein
MVNTEYKRTYTTFNLGCCIILILNVCVSFLRILIFFRPEDSESMVTREEMVQLQTSSSAANVETASGSSSDPQVTTASSSSALTVAIAMRLA